MFPTVAPSATLYRLTMDLSDVDRGVYETLDLRIAQHPSEPLDRVVVRALAYALLYEDGLEFGRGISEAEEPALWTHDLTGRLLHWVDVGLPTSERLHLAGKKADRVSVVCHKDVDLLLRELAKKKVHRAELLTILAIDSGFVTELAKTLERNTSWTIVVQDGELSVTAGERTSSTTVGRPTLTS